MAQKVCLSTLPEEILRLVLGQSGDLDSLLCAVASCRAFHSAFHSFPGPLVAGLVEREISAAVLPHAIQTRRAHRVSDSVRQSPALLPQAVDHVICPGGDGFKWTLADGIAAIRLHKVVAALADVCGVNFLLRWGSLTSRKPMRPISQIETDRTECALYRFQTFCYLFPPPETIVGTSFKTAQFEFLSHFAPWENEQLASIHEALWRIVAPAFNDLALHDISWGEFRIDYVQNFDDLFTEQILSRGLQIIYDISRAATYEERNRLLGCNIPVAAREFLSEAIRSFNFHQIKTYAHENDSIRPTSVGEPTSSSNADKGPDRIWSWCHQMGGPDGIIMEDEYRAMRACGYVFWEMGRLSRSGFLEVDWMDVEIEMTEDVVSLAPDPEEKELSWTERSALYEKGARGYFEGEFRSWKMQ